MSRKPSALFIGACFATLCVSLPSVALAQNPAKFNVSAGATFPTGDFSNGEDIGYNVAAGVGMNQRGTPLGFRFEGQYNEFGQTGTTNKAHSGSITGNVTYDFSGASLVPTSSLYLIGGGGYYNTLDPFFDGQNQQNFGWNVGAGFRFPLTGFSVYVEARYHTVSNTEVRYIPVSFGLVF